MILVFWIFERKGFYKFRYLGYWFYIINDNILDTESRKEATKNPLEMFDRLRQGWKGFIKKHGFALERPIVYYILPESEFYIAYPEDDELPELNDAKDVTNDMMEHLFTEEELKRMLGDLFPKIVRSRLLVGSIITQIVYPIISKYLEKRAPVYSGIELRKAIQPYNPQKIRSQNITHFTFPELTKHPKALEILEKFLKEEHEILISGISSIYEQMAIEIVSTLVYKKPNIKTIRFYFKPSNMKSSEHNGVLTIGRKDLIRRFRLTEKEIKKIFLGQKGSDPAIKRVAKKDLYIKNSLGEIESAHLWEYDKVRVSVNGEELYFIQVNPHAIFYIRSKTKRVIKDDLWKLREIGKKTNSKAQRAVLALRNKFITLTKPLRANLETLAGYAGLSSRKRHEKSLMEKQILEYLNTLKSIGDIEYELSGNIVTIYNLSRPSNRKTGRETGKTGRETGKTGRETGFVN